MLIIWILHGFIFKNLAPEERYINSKDAQFSKDGKYMISGSWDNKAIIWKINADNTFSYFKEIVSHNNDIETVSTAINDKKHLIIATGSSDKTVHLHGLDLNLEKPKLYRIPSVIRHNYSVRSVTFGDKANSIYSADKMGNVKKWDISKFETIIESRTAKLD